MAGARALLCPTTYIEPFGAVAVEAQICGTPAIATDWGAFPETVEQGVGGYRFRTLAEGVKAVELAGKLKSKEIRQAALATYSLDAVGPRYDRWFKQLLTIWDRGWYAGTSPAADTLGE
jgi:glycosyltransferase involved in cell wall biosynthesis